MTPIRFNGAEFDRDLKRSVEQAANDGIRRSAADLQRIFDSVLQTHAGKPAGQVRQALQAASKRRGFTLDTSDLNHYVSAISSGSRVVVSTKPIRL